MSRKTPPPDWLAFDEDYHAHGVLKYLADEGTHYDVEIPEPPGINDWEKDYGSNRPT